MSRMSITNPLLNVDTNSTIPKVNSGWFHDDDLESLSIVASPWPTVTILCLYLWFVLRAGPRLMEKKPAYNLRYVLILYNLFLVVTSTWYIIKINKLAWIYYLSKIVELMDTVFFVLRRKMSQVSFLHVYHHTNMAMLTWVFLRLVPGSQLMLICFSNTTVHILMYGYYFLAALGPSVRKYLWWKKYLTSIQITQFLFIICFFIGLLVVPGCQVPTGMITLAIGNTSTFLVLFLFFYAKSYRNKKVKLQ